MSNYCNLNSAHSVQRNDYQWRSVCTHAVNYQCQAPLPSLFAKISCQLKYEKGTRNGVLSVSQEQLVFEFENMEGTIELRLNELAHLAINNESGFLFWGKRQKFIWLRTVTNRDFIIRKMRDFDEDELFNYLHVSIEKILHYGHHRPNRVKKIHRLSQYLLHQSGGEKRTSLQKDVFEASTFPPSFNGDTSREQSLESSVSNGTAYADKYVRQNVLRCSPQSTTADTSESDAEETTCLSQRNSKKEEKNGERKRSEKEQSVLLHTDMVRAAFSDITRHFIGKKIVLFPAHRKYPFRNNPLYHLPADLRSSSRQEWAGSVVNIPFAAMARALVGSVDTEKGNCLQNIWLRHILSTHVPSVPPKFDSPFPWRKLPQTAEERMADFVRSYSSPYLVFDEESNACQDFIRKRIFTCKNKVRNTPITKFLGVPDYAQTEQLETVWFFSGTPPSPNVSDPRNERREASPMLIQEFNIQASGVPMADKFKVRIRYILTPHKTHYTQIDSEFHFLYNRGKFLFDGKCIETATAEWELIKKEYVRSMSAAALRLFGWSVNDEHGHITGHSSLSSS